MTKRIHVFEANATKCVVVLALIGLIVIGNYGALHAQANDSLNSNELTSGLEREQTPSDRLRKYLKEGQSADKTDLVASAHTNTPFRDTMMPELPDMLYADSITWAKYQIAQQEYYNYRTSGMKHRGRVFEWQLFSAKIIFVVVIVLVFAGIYFAAVQFHAGLARGDKGKDSKETDRTEIEASMKGFKVSSPVLGVIVLMISLGFFFLYLKHVYPIEDVF